MRFIRRGLITLASLTIVATSASPQDETNFRKPKDGPDLRYWLENMVWHHRFSEAEIAAATGLSKGEIAAALRKFDIRAATRPRRPANAPLLVLPYPGGRHPRIGFLEGAIRPQRETKVSVFTPWDDASYVVVDVPEAIFTNLGLTYLAHTHVPTIWEKQKVGLEKLEWNRRPDGTLDIERRLPNGIAFGTKIVPSRTEVRMELWLKNGTKEKLTDMRVQNCVLLKGARGFEAQSNDNKVFAPPYAACKSADGKRWVITAWEPHQRSWGNGKCPCLHSDPRIPDCAPGETQRLRGWLSFYEGDDIQAEFRRIDKTGWRAPPAKDAERLRVLIETDAGGDPDDEQSLVRFLLYTNELDVEGIICTLARARDKENLNPERTGLGIVRRQLKAYGACHPNLVKHDRRYPTLEHLWQRTVAGYDGDAGVKLILAAADADDPRPIWVCNWGTGHDADESSFKRALDRVLRERGQAGYARFKSRFRLSSADRFGEHLRREPAFSIWIDTFRPELDGKRWYHRFAPLTARAGGFDVKRDVLTGHGPLGALYPTNTGLSPQKEGDTMSFLYLVPTGMNDPMQPTWGSWGGRYGLNEKDAPRPHYWANQKDHWEGTTHRDNTLKRWAVHLQNDFRARLKWCVRPKEKANHPPTPHCQDDGSSKILFADAPAGKRFRLSAAGTTDPDGDRLSYRWYVYPEPGSYAGRARVIDSTQPQATLEVPAAAKGRTIHVILEVTDQGEPALTRYRRIVVTGS
jgi:hypothetical protein